MTETSNLSELLLRWEKFRQQGRNVTVEELCVDCPELEDALRERIEVIEPMDWLNKTGGSPAEPQEVESTDTAAEFPLWLCPGAEPVPGYRLIQRQGRGMFGEVWAAQALGRLVAVKFIHGNLDAPRPRRLAEAELEGLVRIKRVSHPHLLKIVGAEVKGATLLLVTELADCTLEQHFRSLPPDCTTLHRCVHASSLLWGAAAALDHLQQNYGLMHLDVKPANLLLVSGVCKLADFGTVKGMRAGGVAPGEVLLAGRPGATGDLPRTTVRYRCRRDIHWREAMHPQATLYTAAWAFTPHYASPEMFQGRASHFSDQYSLALSFCELAGGSIPFSGEAEAQIAQRLEGKMDLSLLSESLRSAVARALSPRPMDRFPHCVDFIKAARRVLHSQDPHRLSAWELGPQAR